MKITGNQDNAVFVHLDKVCKFLIVSILPTRKRIFLSRNLIKYYIVRVISFFAIFFGFFEKVSSCETTAKHGMKSCGTVFRTTNKVQTNGRRGRRYYLAKPCPATETFFFGRANTDEKEKK